MTLFEWYENMCLLQIQNICAKKKTLLWCKTNRWKIWSLYLFYSKVIYLFELGYSISKRLWFVQIDNFQSLNPIKSFKKLTLLNIYIRLPLFLLHWIQHSKIIKYWFKTKVDWSRRQYRNRFTELFRNVKKSKTSPVIQIGWRSLDLQKERFSADLF